MKIYFRRKYVRRLPAPIGIKLTKMFLKKITAQTEITSEPLLNYFLYVMIVEEYCSGSSMVRSAPPTNDAPVSRLVKV